ncbi:MAG: DUF1674 domain-containing protein [Alphaproteobacteria bacterium]|nr:DUF1674 domain-containing protein [Alphaproteobacteria bacterium]
MSLFKKLRGDGAKPDAKEVSGDAISPLLDPEVKGVDARRLAELKAEEAGRKWRQEAEAKGEVAKEIGGPKGLEPTRYGDWEKAGRCYDF